MNFNYFYGWVDVGMFILFILTEYWLFNGTPTKFFNTIKHFFKVAKWD